SLPPALSLMLRDMTHHFALKYTTDGVLLSMLRFSGVRPVPLHSEHFTRGAHGSFRVSAQLGAFVLKPWHRAQTVLGCTLLVIATF
ncbi:MAG: hypothetical protein KAJ19_08720, partial [Gammaproteobacteria bacterium]|nr:hypothetical protein [Gammaproteobacteria bacterium]